MQHFHLAIIGGGPAGYMAAQRAGAAGLSVALFEKRALGGVCLNEGCIPSKALLQSAKLYDAARHSERYGVTAENARLDHPKALARKNKVVKKLVAGVGLKMKQYSVTFVNEAAAVEGRAGAGFALRAGGEVYTADNLLVAAGGAPVLPPIPGVQEGLQSGFVLTSREILDLKEIPSSLVVVGGGVVGLEMASYFHSAGSAVSVVEMLPKIAGPTEAEVSANLLANLQKKGIAFHLGAKVTAVGAGTVTFQTAPDGQTAPTETALPAEKVLLSIGRRPAAAGLGLETLGVAVQRGAVLTDEYMRTNVENVYAAGDVNGKAMLAHTAYREAEVAVNHMLGLADKMRYNAIPSVIYTTPEVASVGETEASAAQKGMKVKVAKLPLSYAGRYVAEVELGDGFAKLLLDADTQTLVGAHMVGSYASETITGPAMMIACGLPLETLKAQIIPHPTVGEIWHELLFEF